MVLLCEYAHRSGQFALAFVLGGCIFRQLRLLDLDAIPPDAESGLVSPESELNIRLAWACYSIDVLLASGVDKNSSWKDGFPHLPLPCSDGEFLSQTSSNPLYLSYVLQNPHTMRRLDAPALSSLLAYLRTKVLR